uniref:Uncharacterized protein n=1 Tax=Desertifilum tharense IPPAS B-1220 TaxID=1781255 RepID=A0ACD5GV09_9CYAN
MAGNPMDKSAIALISALSLSPTQQAVVEGICAEFAALPQVLAIALAGSQTTTQSDFRSDLDIYIYQTAEIPVEVRSVLATRFAQHCEINNQFWETGDEWLALEYQLRGRFDVSPPRVDRSAIRAGIGSSSSVSGVFNLFLG